jgi:hypothetical protein
MKFPDILILAADRRWWVAMQSFFTELFKWH